MVTPDWAVADSYGHTRAQPPGRRESWRGTDPSRSEGGGGSPASAATVRLRVSAGEGAGCRVPGLRPEGVQACRAAPAGGTVVGAGRRQLRRGLTTPATRRKPGRGSVVPRGCVPCGRLTPCLARVGELSARGYPLSSCSLTG